jgi:hypothetical protein
MTKIELLKRMEDLGACEDATEWVRAQTADDAQSIWDSCERGDWMLWLAGRAGVDRKLLVRAACLCAREALRYVPAGEDRPRIAIETAEAWTRGEATIDRVRAAADAADAAYAATYAADAACAAYAAACAADAAYAAACATYAATYAADARKASLKRSADLVRSIIQEVPR